MNKDELMIKILTADPETLARVEGALTVATRVESSDLRLLTFTDAARLLSVSRQTVWRMTMAGRLPLIETVRGRKRIPAAALHSMVRGAA